jgi:hypothetical protein
MDPPCALPNVLAIIGIRSKQRYGTEVISEAR